MTTYTERYSEGNRSREMTDLIRARGQDPVLAGIEDDGNELYVFPADGTEVILTNAGIVTEGAPGWRELRAVILSDFDVEDYDPAPTEAEIQAALDFGKTADQHLPH